VARAKRKHSPKQEPPIQFRPGVELQQLVLTFATEHDLSVNEACKYLAALAVTGLDCRYYDLMFQMAQAMGGPNAFVRCCARVLTALEGGVLATDKTQWLEPERSQFILRFIQKFVVDRGGKVRPEALWFLPEEASRPQAAERVEPTGRARRRKRVPAFAARVMEDIRQEERQAHEAREAVADEAPSSSTGEEPQPQRVRT
jgi:hypothetical protein